MGEIASRPEDEGSLPASGNQSADQLPCLAAHLGLARGDGRDATDGGGEESGPQFDSDGRAALRPYGEGLRNRDRTRARPEVWFQAGKGYAAAPNTHYHVHAY